MDAGGDALEERAAAVEEKGAPRRRSPFLRERLPEPCLRLRPDPGDGAETAVADGSAKLLGRRDPERLRDLDRPLRREAEQAADPDDLRRNGALQFLQLGDLPGLDELKGAGLLDGRLPAGFAVPMPSDDPALREDEDPLDPSDLDMTLGPPPERIEEK